MKKFFVLTTIGLLSGAAIFAQQTVKKQPVTQASKDTIPYYYIDSPNKRYADSVKRDHTYYMKKYHHPDSVKKYSRYNHPDSLKKYEKYNYPDSLKRYYKYNHPDSLKKYGYAEKAKTTKPTENTNMTDDKEKAKKKVNSPDSIKTQNSRDTTKKTGN